MPEAAGEDPACPLCGRPIPPAERSSHHLVPKMYGGRETVVLHRICHRKIHSLWPERDLKTKFRTIEQVAAHPDIAAFVTWLKPKPPGFYQRTEDSRAKRPRRR
jgi:hypothetical protein